MFKIFKVKSPIIKICSTLIYVTVVLFLHFNGGACLYNRFLQIECPGCGVTTAYLVLLKLDILEAFRQNFMFWSAPILYLYFWFDGKLTGKKLLDILILMVILFGFLLKWLITFFII